MKLNNKRSIIIALSIGLIAGFILSGSIDIKIILHPKIKYYLKKIIKKPMSGITASKDVLELCNFERQNDIAKVEIDNAQIEWSQAYVSEGKYSLKCTFPDGGGAIGFYETIPSTWTGYADFKFDVYSEEDNIPLSLFIADENNRSYYDRYNKENIPLKKGWNSIEIPVSEIDSKLILDNIHHLRIFLWEVKGAHTLFFDNIRLTNVSDENSKAASKGEKPIEGAVKIFIYPEKEKAKVSKLLYGTNLCPKMESDYPIWNFIEERGITCFRYPGGGSPGWHWKTGECDFEEKVKNMPLGKIDYLIKFCNKTDTKVIMQVNIETGTPQEAAEFVEYVNKEVNFRIDYWELGNEVYGDWDKAYMTPAKYIEVIKAYSQAMKAIDPTIKIGADWGGEYYDSVKWDETIIKGAADYIDFVSIHWYPNHINSRHKFEGRVHPTPEEVMGNSMKIPNIVKRVEKIIEQEAPHRKGKIEVTFLEWDGSWDAPTSDPDPPYAQGMALWSLANAIFYADSLGQFAENGVTVSAHYNLQECMFGLIRGWDPSEGWGGMKWDEVTIRPKAFAIELFSKHFGDVLIESNVENSPFYYKDEDWWPDSYTGKVPFLTAYASKFSDENKLGIILINKHREQDIDVEISIEDALKIKEDGKLWLLTGPDLTTQNDNQPGTVKIEELSLRSIGNAFIYTLPAHSAVAMEIVLL